MLEHPDKIIRIQAIHLSVQHMLEGAVPFLLKMTAASGAGDADVRTSAFQALLKFRAPESVSVAITALEKKNVTKADVPERNAALRILGELARTETQSVLQAIAQSDPNQETRALAASLLIG
jgi:HEAT repeat protein